MTEQEKRAIEALMRVEYPLEGWYARRAYMLNLKMDLYPERRLLPTEASDVWFLVWRFRRQIAEVDLIARADELINGALHLAFEEKPQVGSR